MMSQPNDVTILIQNTLFQLEIGHATASNLPTELLWNIFESLRFVELLRCRAVCTKWRDIIPGSSPIIQKTLWLEPCTNFVNDAPILVLSFMASSLLEDCKIWKSTFRWTSPAIIRRYPRVPRVHWLLTRAPHVLPLVNRNFTITPQANDELPSVALNFDWTSEGIQPTISDSIGECARSFCTGMWATYPPTTRIRIRLHFMCPNVLHLPPMKDRILPFRAAPYSGDVTVQDAAGLRVETVIDAIRHEMVNALKRFEGYRESLKEQTGSNGMVVKAN
ncbi:hypothetical protein FB567DRAFT_36265 [Paraphoma chrysanthemicola]|uniref:F-box domain-containing protein n=1 Tax=Paraphoma chrysanthemicola TaxID=798071 RepID=A0A8K0RKV4_9PLEO|nr:hypothetical protein FB567DRAFT_36265 [Paraphoma chrysanthemicola]